VEQQINHKNSWEESHHPREAKNQGDINIGSAVHIDDPANVLLRDAPSLLVTVYMFGISVFKAKAACDLFVSFQLQVLMFTATGTT